MVHQPRSFRTSKIQYNNARKMRANPSVKRTKELVHRFLLIGNVRSHSFPRASPSAPTASRPPMMVAILARAKPMAGKKTYQRGSDCGNCMQDAFGVARSIVEVSHEQFPVEPGGDVLIGIHKGDLMAGSARSGYGNEAKQCPIAHETKD